MVTDIPMYDTFTKIRPIEKGMSGDKKYYIETEGNKRLLLRVADISEYEQKKTEYELMKKMVSIGVPMPVTIDFGICNADKNVYTLLEWIDGQEVEEIVPTLREDGEKIQVQRNDVLKRINKKLETAGLNTEPGVLAEQIQIWKDNLKDYLESVRLREELDNENDLLLGKEESLYREISLVCGEDIKTQRQLSKAVEIRKAKLDGREPEAQVEEYNPSHIEERIQTVNEQIRQNDLLISRLSAMLENIPDDESLQRIHEKVLELTEEKQKILFLGEAIETAVQVLSEASLSIQRDYVPSLNREIGDILNTITSGKYKQVNADDSLYLNILSPESPEWVLPEQLSSGTADQVYLALRLAAIRLVEKNGETMPLFFDEPFVQYDEERTENALRLLLGESHTRQIFLFTCKKREIELLIKLKTNEEILTHCLHE